MKARAATHRGGYPLIAVLFAAVIAVLGAGCGSSSSEPSSTAAASTMPATGAAAVLAAIDGSSASGEVSFPNLPEHGQVKIEMEGLEPTTGDIEYLVWVTNTNDKMTLLGTWPVEKDGELHFSGEILASRALLFAEQDEDSAVLVTRANPDRVNEEISKTVIEGNEFQAPAHLGAEVMEGPLVGPAIDQKKREATG